MGAGGWVREYAGMVETVAADAGLQTLLAIPDATAIDFAASKIGIGGDGTANGKFKLLLQNKPDLVTTSAVKESEKASGFADNTEEDLQSNVADPSKFPPEMEANAYIISMFMQLLCQTGASQGTFGSVTRDTFQPYQKIDITYYGAFMGKVPKLGGVVDECALIRGALPSSVKLSAEEGGTLMMTAEIMGAKWSKSFVGTGIPSAGNSILKKPYLKWQNAIVLLDDAYSTAADASSGLKALVDSSNTRFSLQGFELTFANGLIAKFYNSETVQCFVLGKYKVTGTMTIPWVVPGLGDESRYYWKHIQDFRDGITKHLKIYWGNADGTTDNSLAIDMYIKYNTGSLEGEDVLGSNMAFTCVQPIAGTPSAIVYCGHTTTLLNRGLA
jgi:hypothetical protein